MREALFMAAVDLCLDCGVSTFEVGEFAAWFGTNSCHLSVDGMLCIGCLETRLGRRLRRADFTDVPLNWHPRYMLNNSARLKQRLAASARPAPAVPLSPPRQPRPAPALLKPGDPRMAAARA